MRFWQFFSLIFLFLNFSMQLHGASVWQPHESINSAVERFVLSELDPAFDNTISVGRLDKRLKLHLCDQDLNAFWPAGAVKTGNASVGVRCDSERPWKIYVQVSIELMRDVAVLARPVSRGELLEPSMVRFEKQNVSKHRNGFMSSIEGFSEYRFKRAYAAGRVISTKMLKVPLLVSRGGLVSIESHNSAFRIKMKGHALSDGEKGRVIRVKNTSSNRVIQAEVIAKGRVRVLR